MAQGVILSLRHIHMTPQEAQRFKVQDKQKVRVHIEGERGIIFENVLIRVHDNFALEMHLDIDEANACGLMAGAKGYLV